MRPGELLDQNFRRYPVDGSLNLQGAVGLCASSVALPASLPASSSASAPYSLSMQDGDALSSSGGPPIVCPLRSCTVARDLWCRIGRLSYAGLEGLIWDYKQPTLSTCKAGVRQTYSTGRRGILSSRVAALERPFGLGSSRKSRNATLN